MIPTHTMPYEDDVFGPDEELEALLRPDADEEALLAVAGKKARERTKKKREKATALKVTASMAASGGGGRGALISGVRVHGEDSESDDLVDDEDMDLFLDDDESFLDRVTSEGSTNMGPIVAEREREHLQAIFNPLHNARQIAKELTLLEDHLVQPPQHCPDCIRKHLLRAEAYADEAASLDETGEFAALFGDVQQELRSVSRDYLQGGDDRRHRHKLSQRVRRVRKAMSKYGFHTVLESRMRGDAPPQPRIAEVVHEHGSANSFGVKRKRKRTRTRAPREDGYGHLFYPDGDNIADTVGKGGTVLDTGLVGQERKDVWDLQGKLWDSGFFDEGMKTGALDGKYGLRTAAKVEALQRAARLPVTGKFDQKLYRLLFEGSTTGLTGTVCAAPEIVKLGARSYRLAAAQDGLVKLGLLTASQRDGEKGVLGPFTDAAIKNFLTRLGRSTAYARQVICEKSLPADSVLASLQNKSDLSTAASSTLAPVTAKTVSPSAARSYLEGAKMIWPGESESLSDADFILALKDFQFAVGLPRNGTLDEATQAALLDGTKLAMAARNIENNPGGAGGRPWSRNARKAPRVLPGTATAVLSMSVSEAQQRLNDAGAVPPLVVDNTWGSKTKAALSSFQQVAGLAVTGSLDQSTMRALKSAAEIQKVKAARARPAPASVAPVAPSVASRPVPPSYGPPTLPSYTPPPALTLPTSPSQAPLAATQAAASVLPPGFGPDPTGSYAAAFKSRFPAFATRIDALVARERQIRSLASYGAADDRQISTLARDWWALSLDTGDVWPAMHAA